MTLMDCILQLSQTSPVALQTALAKLEQALGLVDVAKPSNKPDDGANMFKIGDWIFIDGKWRKL
jgi:hypothetical protein